MRIILTLIALFNLNINLLQTNQNETNNILIKNFGNVKIVITSWMNSDYKYSFKFKKDGEYYNVFMVKEENQNKGYFILNEIGELESFYSGCCDNIDFSDYSSISPIFSSGIEINNDLNNNINTVNTSNVNFLPPVLYTNLYRTSSSSYHSEQLITGCPFYYNASYGPVSNGCFPTAGAMLISFYDRYSELDNLLEQELPLNHEDDKTRVDNLIIELAGLMGTNTICDGTTTSQIMSGYNQYLTNKGYYGYQARYVGLYDDYSYIINTYKNPAHLNIVTTKGEWHSVLGVGTATVRESGRFMITHYDWYKENEGDYYVAEKYFKDCKRLYLYRKLKNEKEK